MFWTKLCTLSWVSRTRTGRYRWLLRGVKEKARGRRTKAGVRFFPVKEWYIWEIMDMMKHFYCDFKPLKLPSCNLVENVWIMRRVHNENLFWQTHTAPHAEEQGHVLHAPLFMPAWWICLVFFNFFKRMLENFICHKQIACLITQIKKNLCKINFHLALI